ncbi:CBN-CLEC-50 protein [Aphelenchoides avenae]|nr:CBN-CLEC-50 protein [Aphelenchus avenae]
MTTSLFLASLLLISGSVSARCPQNAVQGPNPDDCYAYAALTGTWTAANIGCHEMGGNLTFASDADSNAFLMTLPNIGYGGPYWLGGRKSLVSGQWMWADGSYVSWLNWENSDVISKPNASSLCLAFDGTSGLWKSMDCGAKLAFICKVPPNEHEVLVPGPGQQPIPIVGGPSVQNEPNPPAADPCPERRSSGKCEAGWTHIVPRDHLTGKCYKVFSPAVKSWKEGRDFCRLVDSQLVSINSDEENNAIMDWLSTTSTGYFVSIGLNNIGSFPQMRWIDGKTEHYGNWLAGEPKTMFQDQCAFLINGFNATDPQRGMWTSAACKTSPNNDDSNPLCEKLPLDWFEMKP